MAAEAIPAKKKYSFEEYLQLEQQEGVRYEYHNGEVFAMAGGTFNHSDISFNVNSALNSEFRKRGCRSFQADVKVQLRNGENYLYPDVVLTCNVEDANEKQFIKHPVLIVEVLSPSTESHDRNVKWHQYRRIPSLKYFLFVSQEKFFVELYSRTQPNALYTYQAFENIEDIIEFSELQFSLPLKEIYENIFW